MPRKSKDWILFIPFHLKTFTQIQFITVKGRKETFKPVQLTVNITGLIQHVPQPVKFIFYNRIHIIKTSRFQMRNAIQINFINIWLKHEGLVQKWREGYQNSIQKVSEKAKSTYIGLIKSQKVPPLQVCEKFLSFSVMITL